MTKPLLSSLLALLLMLVSNNLAIEGDIDLALHSFNLTDILKKVASACEQHCHDETNYFNDEPELNCLPLTNNSFCIEKRCLHGCRQWWPALQESTGCTTACVSAYIKPYDMICISACNMAQHNYWHLLQLSVQALGRQQLPPQAYHASNGSMHLEWPIDLPMTYLFDSPSYVQYHSSQMATSTFFSLHAINCRQTFHCLVPAHAVLPSADLSFRFVMRLGWGSHNIVYSPSSNIITSSRVGPPATEPVLREFIEMGATHFACVWQDNVGLVGYRLSLQAPNSHVLKETILDARATYFIFDNLSAESNYTLKLAKLNEYGEGPSAELLISSDMRNFNYTQDFLGHINSLLLVGEFSIKLKTLKPIMQTRTIFESDELISDYDVELSSQLLYVITADGNIYRQLLNDTSGTKELLKFNNETSMKIQAQKIAIDWINHRIFMATKVSNEEWMIVSTDMDLNEFEVLSRNLSQPIEQLRLDPINGWLFYRGESSLSRLNLATQASQIVVQDGQLGHFVNDYARFLLLAYNKSDSSFWELSYDGNYSRVLPLQQSNFSPILFGEIYSFFYADVPRLLVATNGTHLHIENEATSDYELLDLSRDVEWCTSLHIMSIPSSQPIPTISHHSPLKLQALFSDNMANISWQPPQVNFFQTLAAFRQWEYELEIMDVASNSAFTIRNIRTTFFNVQKLQANNVYSLRVRTMGVRSAGPWSPAMTARTWPQGEHKLLWATNTGLYETNELGQLSYALTTNEAIVRDFVQCNHTIYYVDGQHYLRCSNINNPDFNCSSFSSSQASSLAYDWRGAKLYWTDVERDCVIRANLDGSERELLPIFGAQQLELDAFNGHLYYAMDGSLLRRSLSGSFAADLVEFYKLDSSEECLLGFALDLLGQRLYWLVLKAQNEVLLISASTKKDFSTRNVSVLAVEADIGRGTLQYLSAIKSLMWLDAEGSKATFMRLEHLAQSQATLELYEMQGINMAKYKSDYMPFRDDEVIPGQVDETSIVLSQGYWNDFHIKWTPPATKHNDTLYYKIRIRYSVDQIIELETREPQLHLVDLPLPQLVLHVSLAACSWWQNGPRTEVQIVTPAAEKAEPKLVRVYLEQIEMPLESHGNLSAHVRWNAPENISKNAVATYKVFCYLGEQLFAERVSNYSSDKPLESIIGGLEADATYAFQVQAFAPGSFGTAEKSVNFSLHVNAEIQSVPRLLYATSEYIGELDLDLRKHTKLVHITNSIEHLAYVQSEQRLLWVNENVELMSYIIGSTPIKLARMRAEVISLTVDWIARIVYWAELTAETEAVAIYKLDLCQFEGRVLTGTKILTTSRHRIIRDLLVLPFSQTLLWLEFEKGSTNASLNGRNLTQLSIAMPMKDMSVLHMFEGKLTADMEIVNLMVANGKMCGYDVHRQLCTPLKLNLIEEHVRQVERDNGYIYALNNDSILAYHGRKQHLEFQYNMTDVQRIKAFNRQMYPARKCLLPQHEQAELYEHKLQPVIKTTEESYVILDLPNINTDEECWLAIPGLKYGLTISDTMSNYTQVVSTSHGGAMNISQLQAYRQYRVQMRIVSYYQQKLGLPPLEIQAFLVKTREGVPTRPRNLTVVALNPTEIEVSWQPPDYQPCHQLWYQLHWQIKGNASTGAHLTSQDTNITLSSLKAGSEYGIVVKAHCSPEKFNSSGELLVRTYAQLEELHLLQQEANNLTLSWSFAEHVTRVVLVCQAINSQVEQDFSMDITAEMAGNMTVIGLLPKTMYDFSLELQYAGVERFYQWPQRTTERFVFETLGTAPGAPGQPQIELIAGEIFRVFWSAAAANGEPIVEYSLEALQARQSAVKRRRRNTNLNSVEQKLKNNRTIITMLSELPWADELEPIEDKWLVYCNTSELSCIVRDLHTLRLLMFRVRARNEAYGWGAYSEDSEHVQEPFLSAGKRNSLVLAILAPAAIVSSCVIMLVIIRMVKSRRVRAKKLLEKSRPSVWSNMSSLQQHHQLMMSRHRAQSVASHQSTLYNGGPLSDADIALLPHISWSQITLLNFLGSGAFGEVYQGLVKYDDNDDNEPERVAIKSLRKGASEFSELLREAQLMSNFRHENIVRLVGVCCDTESISIIMEHMEGGDLLNYLRECRPNTSPATVALELKELVVMCLDVARGCAYLEEMHFVHRDLACRNCLVSSRDPTKRQVKIGDFGLARDIYKSDYYRKEGEGLLPVRWMSPESLVDGIFTTQSDVWAFAVLCWEILSYGQQPYAARNNFEVLNYVKEGGRLDKPNNCPDQLFTLLLECWQWNAEERPSFARCLDTLSSLAYQLDECKAMKAIYANEMSFRPNKTLGLSSDNNNNDNDDDDAVQSDLKEFYSLPTHAADSQTMPNIPNNTNKYEGVSKF